MICDVLSRIVKGGQNYLSKITAWPWKVQTIDTCKGEEKHGYKYKPDHTGAVSHNLQEI